MLVQLLLVVLSAVSLGGVRWILVQPSCAVEQYVHAPRVLAAVADATLDIRGLY